MTSLPGEFSSAPVPDWLRRRKRRISARIVLHQPFEAPYRSLIRAASCTQSAARLWARLAVEIMELNRGRFRSRRLVRSEDMKAPASGSISTPRWVSVAAALPAFAALSVEKWVVAINAMIREQLPHFHLHPDWRHIQSNDALTSRAQMQILKQIDREVRRLAGVRRFASTEPR